jgi:hypothetical protein
VPQHKKRRPSANFCKHRSWILANTSEIQQNAGTGRKTLLLESKCDPKPGQGLRYHRKNLLPGKT